MADEFVNEKRVMVVMMREVALETWMVDDMDGVTMMGRYQSQIWLRHELDLVGCGLSLVEPSLL
jgi:hypothetical protein